MKLIKNKLFNILLILDDRLEWSIETARIADYGPRELYTFL